MVKISPSILASDFSRLGQEVSAMEAAGVDMVHIGKSSAKTEAMRFFIKYHLLRIYLTAYKSCRPTR